jgi:hypothetical protein
VFCSVAGDFQPSLGKFRIRDATIENFKDFMRILISHGGDMALASRDLKDKYGDTYWYYLYSAKPKK